jgi:hypothetical protein
MVVDRQTFAATLLRQSYAERFARPTQHSTSVDPTDARKLVRRHSEESVGC